MSKYPEHDKLLRAQKEHLAQLTEDRVDYAHMWAMYGEVNWEAFDREKQALQEES